MTSETLSSKPTFLGRKIFPGVTVAMVMLTGIMLLSLGLHMYNIASIGDANAYYTAAVKSMLQSWSNFFFVAAEPGGSVTVDKPPLGLWIEAVFAYFLGVNGFSVSLPNILAGVFGIPLLYAMVKRYMGELAGLVAALVMAFTPIFVATNRNNTMDGLLVFFLLLAAWAFIRATETGRLRWLLLGAFLVGLGFNIKMLQAFLPLPAFYALYFLGSKQGWIRKMLNLGLATVLLAGVSLSWAVVVDLVPADQRPYIGSSGDNTVMGLIFGHNGTSRLFGGGNGGQQPAQAGQSQQNGLLAPPNGQAPAPAGNPGQPPQSALDACIGQAPEAACSFDLPNRTISGVCIMPPNQNQLTCVPQGGPQGGPAQAQNGQQGGTPFSQETGAPGVLRFFTQPLSKQMSWVLPFALISLGLAVFGGRIRLPIEAGAHKSLVLWGGWLGISLVFFSAISGIFHSYYAIMLAPALGAVVGMGFAQLWDWGRERIWPGVLLLTAAAVTLAFQAYAFTQYGEALLWIGLAAVTLLAGGVMLILMTARRFAYVLVLIAMLVAPIYWTTMTIVSNGDQNLPTAYQGNQQPGAGSVNPGVPPNSSGKNEMIAYLETHTQDVEYLVAVPSSQQGAMLVLETGRPVLYMGGFGGQDEVATAADLSDLVSSGKLRYVLYGGDRGGKQAITAWLQSSCAVVPEFSQPATNGSQAPRQNNPGNQAVTLYMCR